MAQELQIWKSSRELMPFRQFERMKRNFDQLWDSFFGRELEGRIQGEWIPSLDLAETDNELVVKAELPGMDSKNIDISLSDGMPTIKGQKKQEKEEKELDYHFMERSYGSFTRSIQLPKQIQREKISASYKNGLLRITLPKSEEAKKKEVKIKLE